MEENFQVIFNIIFVSLLYIIGLSLSLTFKFNKAKNDKEKSEAVMETIGVGILAFFLIVLVFMVGLGGSFLN